MTLIENWRDWWRFWSVRLQLFAGFLLAFIEVAPDAITSAWLSLPPAFQGHIDTEHVRYAAYAALAFAVIARVIRQQKLHAEKPDN